MNRRPPEFLIADAALLEQTLDRALPQTGQAYQEVYDAARYSLLGGGKRVRGSLCLSFARLCGAQQETALPFACAVEMAHCYSLIHDDLPAMDNDDYRRGKPSCHKAFGEGIALLAGDLLLTAAFETISTAPGLPDTKRAAGVAALAKAVGGAGMIGGQVVDLANENNPALTAEQLDEINSLKTGKLLAASAVLGCIAAGAQESALDAAERFAMDLGAAFQIVDDILDVTGDEQLLGKAVGSDAREGKRTYAALLGIEGARLRAAELTQRAKDTLRRTFANPGPLEELADYLLYRDR